MEKHKIYVVGIGPGAYEGMTVRAAKILEGCDLFIGYTAYIDLVREHFPGKTFLAAPMTRELARCEQAFREARRGRRVAVVCSGDAGVYGMAGLMLEVGRNYPDCEVETVAGVTAALGGAALLGAPLGHDFALVSLSDLLTPWEKIEKRLAAAAMADFVICLYNPSSKKRAGYLEKACDIVLRYASPETVCGMASRIGREGENWRVFCLRELREKKADMFTTVFIGNSQTMELDGKMVTPRGYFQNGCASAQDRGTCGR